MLRLCSVLTCFYLVFSASAFADTVTLRTRIEANGPAITLGDVFDGAGAVAGRAIAPSPPSGQMTSLSMPLLAAAASAAGLEFTPPSGVNSVTVVRPGGAAATIAAPQSGGRSLSTAAVHRGEVIALLYRAPGMTLSTRARALEDAEVGQNVRLVNLTSNRTVDGVVTGPGAASATPQ
jgi:flagella basal body P-ring formation protein FlgA